MVKSTETKKPIGRSLREFFTISDHIWIEQDLSDKDELFERLCQMMKEVYPRVNMPCKDVIDVAKTMETILRIGGTTTKLQLKPKKRSINM